MNTENLTEKPKIFINSVGGGSAHFLCMLLVSLIRDNVQLIESHRAHKDLYKYNRYHNWQSHWHDQTIKKYISGISEFSTTEAVEYIQQTYKFYPTPDPFYIIQVHANNPIVLMTAFDNAKLIQVIINDNDKDQLAYNWVTKSCFLHNQWDDIRQGLKRVKNRYNRLLDVLPESINNQTDLKLLTYIQRYSVELGHQLYQKYNVETSYPKFSINFSDIADKKLINQLDSLINFLEVPAMPEKKANAIALINQYADAQTPAPWKLTLEDYN